MDKALDKDNNIVYAVNAEYGIYFCPECKKVCCLRIPYDKKHHFYHLRIDSNCSLSFKNDNQYFRSIEVQTKCNNAIEILTKNTTKENWFEAINCLIKYNQLDRLRGCHYAIQPLSKYYKEKYLSKTIAYKILIVIMDNQNEYIYPVVELIERNDYLSKKEKKYLYEALIRRMPEIDMNYLKSVEKKKLDIDMIAALVSREIFSNQRDKSELYEYLYSTYKSVLDKSQWTKYLDKKRRETSQQSFTLWGSSDIESIKQIVNNYYSI